LLAQANRKRISFIRCSGIKAGELIYENLIICWGWNSGTMVANKMVRVLDSQKWEIIIVDKEETH